MKKDTIIVNLTPEVVAKLTKRAEQKGFDNVISYVEDLLNQIVQKMEQTGTTTERPQEEIERVKKKLKDLGYL